MTKHPYDNFRARSYEMIDDFDEMQSHQSQTTIAKTKCSRSFDLASWIEQGSLCRSSCYDQLQTDSIYHTRTTSYSSTTSITEDNSSYNDSFDEICENYDQGFPLQKINNKTRYQASTANVAYAGHHYSNSQESYQSLELPRLRLGTNLDGGSQSTTIKPRSIPYSPKTYSDLITKCKSDKTNMTVRGKPKREWKTAIDPKSGKKYYYDVNTRETQWQKPLDLATREERRVIEEKERKQRDFFKAMEKNILKSMQSGNVPGVQVSVEEDTVESLPKPSSGRTLVKPRLVRTISSMDDELLLELTNIESEFNSLSSQSSNNTSESLLSTIPSLSPSATSSFSSCDDSSDKLPSKSLSKPILSKRNTCGTMYVGSTMADPDKDAAIKCVCGVYRTHIVQSESESNSSPVTKFAEYEVFNDILDKRSKTSPQNASITETTSCGFELQIGPIDKEIPSLEEITAYFRFIFYKAQMESDCIIMSLIYVERLLRETNGGVRPNLDNWKSLLFSCMIMASKVWDDLSMWNADFSQACPEDVTFSLQRINELELAVLSCLKYNVKVTASEYAKYYFLMRSMLIRSGLAGEEFSSAKPLDMERAKKFEFLTASYNANPTKPGGLRRAKSDGDGCNSKSSSSASTNLEQVVNM